eukprot:3203384-Pleurochrysis_carterae.AAC.1
MDVLQVALALQGKYGEEAFWENDTEQGATKVAGVGDAATADSEEESESDEETDESGESIDNEEEAPEDPAPDTQDSTKQDDGNEEEAGAATLPATGGGSLQTSDGCLASVARGIGGPAADPVAEKKEALTDQPKEDLLSRSSSSSSDTSSDAEEEA